MASELDGCTLTSSERYSGLELFGGLRICEEPEIFQVALPVFEGGSAEEPRFTVNCYLVKRGNECLVVDPGEKNEPAKKMLLGCLNVLGISIENVSFFVTHLHIDHGGMINAPEFRNCPVYMSKAEFDDACTVADHATIASLADRLVAEGLPRSEAQKYQGTPWCVYPENHGRMCFVADGEYIAVGDLSLLAVATPGHAVGHMALFEEKSGFCFSGDFVLFGISPMLRWTLDSECVLDSYLDALRRLLTMDVTLLCVAHGRPREDWAQRAEWLISHHLERVARMEKFINEQPGHTGMEIAGDAGWSLPLERWGLLSKGQRVSVLSGSVVYLDHLLNRGYVRAVTDERGLRRYYPA